MVTRGGSHRALRRKELRPFPSRLAIPLLLVLACALVWVAQASAIQPHPRVIAPLVDVVGERASTPDGSGAAAAEAGGLHEQAPPSISGAPVQGAPVAATPGNWTGGGQLLFAYRWQRCDVLGGQCVAAQGATSQGGSQYTPTAEDVGGALEVEVTARNALEAAGPFTSAASSRVRPAPGAAVAWGQNVYGGDGQVYRDSREENPVGIEAIPNIVEVADADSVTLALLSSGEVLAWGSNGHGQLGDDGFKSNWELGQNHVVVKEFNGGALVPMAEVEQVAAADEHALALRANGAVYAWGSNARGELGNGRGGTVSVARTPTRVAGVSEAHAIAAGGGSDYAIVGEDRQLLAWGGNTAGQLSAEGWPAACENRGECISLSREREKQRAEEKERETHEKVEPLLEAFPELCRTEVGFEQCEKSPTYVVMPENGISHRVEHVQQVFAGAESAYALLENGELLSWGSNRAGQLGRPEVPAGAHSKFVAPAPAMRANPHTGKPEVLTEVVEVSAGNSHVLVRLRDREVLGWGADGQGQLGAGKAEICSKDSEIRCFMLARRLEGLEGAGSVESIAAGGDYSLVAAAHEAYAFGNNNEGELGQGTRRGPEECVTPRVSERFAAKLTKAEAALRAKLKAARVPKAMIAKRVAKLRLTAAMEKEEQHACSARPLPVRELQKTMHEAPGALEHVARVAASDYHALAILEPGVVPPASVVSDEPENLAGRLGLAFSWRVPVSRVVYRLFERPGEAEAEPEPGEGAGECSEGEGEEEGECGELGQGDEGGLGPPFNTLLPSVKHRRNPETEQLELGETGVIGVFEVGERVEAHVGKWTGTNSPMKFSFQWRRCTAAGACENAGSSSQSYEIVPTDARHTLEVIVTASNTVQGAAAAAVASSEPTALVKEKGQGRSAKGESIGSPGAGGEQYTGIEGAGGATLPLEEAGYEFKLSWTKANEEEANEEQNPEKGRELPEHGKTLVTVATPRSGAS
ncbi:MAG: repeat-containing protein [Solirubrobacterales bacterium]|nr:repeat-containing protein [Solirubrobacterales bacterium]